MDAAIECTHCKVVMTSWSAPNSPIRYYQCPFCARTHSSLYGEVFRRRAGARMVEAPARASGPAEIPMASAEDIRWAQVKATAAQWFARIEADQRTRAPREASVSAVAPVPVPAPAAAPRVPTRTPAPVAARAKRK